MEKSSELLKECTEKTKVSSAEIVVHGTREKPYYEIKYHDLSDGQTHVGYSSYNLDFVFEWLEECFEIINQAADTIEALSAKLQAANIENGGGWITGRVPTKEECGNYGRTFNVTVDANGLQTMSMKFEYETARGKEVCRWKWFDRLSPWEVIAWQPLPEPYRP